MLEDYAVTGTDARTLGEAGIGPGTRVLAAFSGGADSTALLLMLKEALDGGLIAGLTAAHFHHGLRGETADRDLAFSKALAERLGIPFVYECGDVPGYAQSRGLSAETAARELRYAFLERVRAESGSDVIATAHHMDDQAETVLMHLIRGTGLKGLGGMRPSAGKIARPLLGLPHEALCAYLTERGEAWCEDETNASTGPRRNRIRLELLPLLKELNPAVTEGLCRTAAHLRADEDLLGGMAEEALERARTEEGFLREPLSKEPEPVRRRALMLLAAPLLGYDYTAEDALSLERLLTAPSGRTANLSGGHTAETDGPLLVFDPEKKEPPAPQPLAFGAPLRYGGYEITLERVNGFVQPADAYHACIARDAFGKDAPVTVRFPRAGDRFEPMGLGGSRLVSDIFTDRKVKRADRNVPLVLIGEEIVFIPGYTVSEKARVTKKTIMPVTIGVRKES